MREKRFYSSDESFERVKTLERKTPRAYLDLALPTNKSLDCIALRLKATNTRDKRLEFLEFERAKICERAKVAETNVALLQPRP